MTEPRPTPPWWRQLRGVLVALHVLAVLLMAAPAPGGGMNKSAWADPTVQEEFNAWRLRLAAVGLEWSPEEFEDQLWTFAKAFTKGRNATLAPFKPYHKWCGARQGWRMFVAPHRYPARLFVEVHQPDGWHRVYEQLHPTHNWREQIFEHDRTRSVLFRYPWPQYRRSWSQFARWIRDRAAEDFPTATQVRMGWFKYKTLTPAQVAAGAAREGTVRSEKSFELEPAVETSP